MSEFDRHRLIDRTIEEIADLSPEFWLFGDRFSHVRLSQILEGFLQQHERLKKVEH